jgi:hypothetical protein
VYGINATGNAVGPQVISCGVNKQLAAVGESVTWIVVHDATKITPATYEWVSILTGDFVAPINNVTKVHSYASVGTKTALVKVTTTTGEVYAVDCDGTAIGASDPGYPSVLIGSFDVRPQSVVTPSGAQQDVSVSLSGLVREYLTSHPAGVTFTSQFEIDDDDADTAFDYQITSSGVTAIVVGVDENVTGSWTPTAQGTYYLRLCVDKPIDAIGEGATNESNNCQGTWTAFNVGPPPTLPPAGTCTVTPKLSKVNGEVLWVVTPSGGTPPYTYAWTFIPAPATILPPSASTDANRKVMYNAVGTKSASVIISTVAEGAGPSIGCTSSVRIQIFEETPG